MVGLQQFAVAPDAQLFNLDGDLVNELTPAAGPADAAKTDSECSMQSIAKPRTALRPVDV